MTYFRISVYDKSVLPTLPFIPLSSPLASPHILKWLPANHHRNFFLELTFIQTFLEVGRDSSVRIATDYGLDRPGIESRWRRDFPHPSRPALRPIQPPIQWVSGLSRGGGGGRVGCGRGVTLTPHPFYCRGQKYSTATPLLSLRAFVAYERVKPAYLFRTNVCHITISLWSACLWPNTTIKWLPPTIRTQKTQGSSPRTSATRIFAVFLKTHKQISIH
jgi:hypothetical protein